MTAHVHPSARLHPGVVLGPGAVVGPEAELQADCVLGPYAVVGPRTTLGPRCRLHAFAVVGGDAQDRRTPPDAPTRLVCGAENVFREHVTVSRGSLHGVGLTRLGAGNLLMAGVHVGHDCHLGDGITLANNVSLAGHVHVGDRVGIGGHAAVHQFVRLGTLSFIAANAMVSQDVPPGCLAAGDRARLYGLNVTGLRRAGVPAEVRRAWHSAFRWLCASHGGGGEDGDMAGHERELRLHPQISDFIDFIRASTRGICRAAGRSADDRADAPFEGEADAGLTDP